MSSVYSVAFVAIACVSCARADGAPVAPLRVCADPNNLPFSDEAKHGFENELASLIARDLHTEVEYTWFPQRRGFIRNTLNAHTCDLVIGVPAGYDLVATTKPYYRSGYVFVTRADRKLDISSFDDPRLATLTIGLHAIGDDYAMLPPGKELAAHGLVDRIVGYSIYGDYSEDHPPSQLIDAVARGDVDIAIAWGPLAGYFARHAKPALRVTPIASTAPGMAFSIAMGVRKDDAALRERVDRILSARRAEIRRLLSRYGVPLLDAKEVPR